MPKAIFLLVCLGVIVLGLTIPPRPVYTQPERSQSRTTRPPVRIEPRLIQLNRRAPVAFKPLPMVDPRTNQPVTPGTMITLDNGKQITAAKFYEQMNRLEMEFNKLGHSFRDAGKDVLLGAVIFDKNKVRAQAAAARFVRPGAAQAAKLTQLSQEHRAYIRKVNPYFGKPLPTDTVLKVAPGSFAGQIGKLKAQNLSVAAAVPAASVALLKVPKDRPDLIPAEGALTAEKVPNPATGVGPPAAGTVATTTQVNAGWSPLTFYVNVKGAQLRPLAPRYRWQVVRATAAMDNFGPLNKAWGKDFELKELEDWAEPMGKVRSETVSFLPKESSSPLSHVFNLNLHEYVGLPPANTRMIYLVRVVPMNADGSLAGYPSRPVIVSYGKNPVAPVVVPTPPPPKTALYPTTAVAQDQPWVLGDKSIMGVELRPYLKSGGSATEQHAIIGFDTNVSVFGVSFSLLNLSAAGDVRAAIFDQGGKQTVAGMAHGLFTAKAANGLIDFCQGLECEKSDAVQVSLPKFDYVQVIDEGFQVGFPIGPIDISARARVRGAVGVGGTIDVAAVAGKSIFTTGINGSVGPHASINVSIEGAVGTGVGGFDIVKVGVGGDVNLISLGFVVGVNVDGVAGTGNYYGRFSELHGLQGQLYGFAEVGVCPVCKVYKVILLEWPAGYDLLRDNPDSATLFAQSF